MYIRKAKHTQAQGAHMTNNQKFSLFQKSLRKNKKWAQHMELPFKLIIKVHLWMGDKKEVIEFTMAEGNRRIDASQEASKLTQAKFGPTREQMEYIPGWFSQVQIFDQASGKQFKF